MSPTETKEEAHSLIEQLAPGQVTKAVTVLREMLDPVARAQADAPFEDEEISEEEELAAARAKLGTPSPSAESHEAFLAEFGLSAEDWDRLGDTPLSPSGETQ